MSVKKSITQMSDMWSFTDTPSGAHFNSYSDGKMYFVLTPDQNGLPIDSMSTWIGMSAGKLVSSLNGVVSAING